MSQCNVTLRYRLPQGLPQEQAVELLGKAGCNDMLLLLGVPGQLSAHITAGAGHVGRVVAFAMQRIEHALPGATFVQDAEVSAVGLEAFRCGAAHEPAVRVLYLGISGVCHPSASLYELVHGCSPWDRGHHRYEAIPWLEIALARWSDVRVVLTSTQPWKRGLPAVLENLGRLGGRVIGFTYEDVTEKVMRQVRTRSGIPRLVRYSSEDYWRMNKSGIVVAHVDWLKPSAWVAVDDEDILWPQKLKDHVCIVDGCKGLADPAEQDRLLTYLQMNFGPGGMKT